MHPDDDVLIIPNSRHDKGVTPYTTAAHHRDSFLSEDLIKDLSLRKSNIFCGFQEFPKSN